MAISEIDQLVEKYFCGTPALYPCRILDGSSRREVIEHTLYRYDIVGIDDKPLTLQIYVGVAEFGHLWEQEVRVLLRTAALDHPSLPAVLGGGYKSRDEVEKDGFSLAGFAYVITEGGEEFLSDGGALAYMRQRPVEAVRQFSLLADALANLHDLGVAHRNLWPATIDVRVEPDSGPQLRLIRFEMSTLVENLLRSRTIDVHVAQAHDLLLGQGAAALAYMAPERLYQIFPGDLPEIAAEDQKSDVYSLAAIVWEWFAGPMPAGELAGADLDDSVDVREKHRKLGEEMRRQLRTSPELPAPLCKLLEEMLNPDPRFRPRSSQVATEIADRFDALTSLWAGTSGEVKYLLTFVPPEYYQTLYSWGGWMTDPPNSPEGRRQLQQAIERDLTRGILVYAPRGAEPFVSAGDSATKRQATALLLGDQLAWFCQPFRPSSAWGTTAAVDDVLIIKYVVQQGNSRGGRLLSEHLRDPLAKRLGAIEAFPFDIARNLLAQKRQNRPKWTPLLEATIPTVAPSDEDLVFGSAFDWFLDYQETALRAREYAYELVSQGNERHLRVRLDRARDERRQRSSAMGPLYASSPRRRPSFGDFFKNLLNDDGSGDIEVLADESGRPGDFASAGRVFFSSRLNDDAIEVRRAETTSRIPPVGWLRPQGDVGDRVTLRRQRAARAELMKHKVLMRQLQSPTTIPGFREPWVHAGDGLEGGDMVADLLACQPLYALQGPPGTGKTEFAARAIGAYLSREPTSRVLVSAQSNYALDNLALRVLDHVASLPAAPVVTPLRIVTNSSVDRADERMHKYFPTELATTQQQELQERLSQRIGTAPAAQQSVLAQWLKRAAEAGPELADRLGRSANLVFATCSAAAEEAFFTGESAEPFNWVMVEEAAKAWPTELAIPLIRGLRWTLIGDQQQLPAHRIDDVTKFLFACADDIDPEMRAHGQQADKYIKVFKLFESLFKHRPPELEGLQRPVGTLTTQFRMIDPIGDLISRIFYTEKEVDDLVPGEVQLPDGWLRTGRRRADIALTAPKVLAGRALVWVDTAGLPNHGDEPTWSNEGEADVVARLVERLRPTPRPKRDGYSADPLAILTPYRRQAELLRRHPPAEPYVATVPAFQGRQADIVLVSLVRDTPRGARERPGENIGFLTQPELVNVMLSRARDLLVVVGDFRHFATYGNRMWAWICESFRTQGCVITAKEAARS